MLKKRIKRGKVFFGHYWTVGTVKYRANSKITVILKPTDEEVANLAIRTALAKSGQTSGLETHVSELGDVLLFTIPNKGSGSTKSFIAAIAKKALEELR